MNIIQKLTQLCFAILKWKEVKDEPNSSDFDLIVMWYPNHETRNPQYKARTTENDTFDVQYSPDTLAQQENT